MADAADTRKRETGSMPLPGATGKIETTQIRAPAPGYGAARASPSSRTHVRMLRQQEPAADGTISFASDLPPDLVRDLKGRALTLTLVSETGASEAHWLFP